jgi:hypothetical protein
MKNLLYILLFVPLTLFGQTIEDFSAQMPITDNEHSIVFPSGTLINFSGGLLQAYVNGNPVSNASYPIQEDGSFVIAIIGADLSYGNMAHPGDQIEFAILFNGEIIVNVDVNPPITYVANNFDIITTDNINLSVGGNPVEFGCMDNNYLEFNPYANIDDGSCTTVRIDGCTDSQAFNYYSEANFDDGSCDYYIIDDMTLNELEEVVSTDQFEVYAYFSYLIDSLSSQIQDLQEALISETLEEEVVSYANSFDVLNPLLYNGEFEAVNYNFSNGNYIVPNGKTLIINQFHDYGSSHEIRINNIILGSVNSSASSEGLLDLPIIVSENNEISNPYSSNQNLDVTFHGLLINKNLQSIHHDFVNGDYVVPENKTLVIHKFTGSNPNRFHIDNIKVFTIQSPDIEDGLSIPFYANSNSVISNPNYLNYSSFHGYLLDNSNYTFATDYELIDALNEGVDSLSTLSEGVALENDSISSQNAILSQENEALMVIDYNFDSLQYVADYLSTQVFDLQQELLVPNIDVDMAIGWNMIGFSCPVEKELTDALNEIVDKVLIMKNNNGSVFMPEFSFNGIGDLTPGHGYQIKVADYILDFNICE